MYKLTFGSLGHSATKSTPLSKAIGPMFIFENGRTFFIGLEFRIKGWLILRLI